jgi:uncharacterized damage-inducible protein DinB
MKRLTLAIAALLPGLLQAQTGSAAVGTARELWQGQAAYITAAAEDMPEAKYGYKPVATVRSFGEIIGHVAGAQYLICAAALGDPPRAEDAIEKSKTTKADLVAALKASTEYCKRAYAQTDAVAQQPTELLGATRTRLYALGLNATHDGEHYGNLITYLRMNGMVPPSSRRP